MPSPKYNTLIRAYFSWGILLILLSAMMAGCSGTRPDNLGVKGGQLAVCPSSPNCISSQSGRQDQLIAPLTLKAPADGEFQRLKSLLRLRQDVKVLEENEQYARVEFHTRLFIDDGEFLLDRQRGVIHLRSASRIGYSDLGKNRSRMEEIRRMFEKGAAE